MSVGIITGMFIAGSGATLMARLRGNAGQLLTAESLSAITWQATNMTTGALAGSGTLTPAQVVFDALVQNDPRWTADSVGQLGADATFGYNFLATIPAATFPITTLSGQPLLVGQVVPVYRVDVKFVPLSGEVFYAAFQGAAAPVFF